MAAATTINTASQTALAVNLKPFAVLHTHINVWPVQYQDSMGISIDKDGQTLKVTSETSSRLSPKYDLKAVAEWMEQRRIPLAAKSISDYMTAAALSPILDSLKFDDQGCEMAIKKITGRWRSYSGPLEFWAYRIEHNAQEMLVTLPIALISGPGKTTPKYKEKLQPALRTVKNHFSQKPAPTPVFAPAVAMAAVAVAAPAAAAASVATAAPVEDGDDSAVDNIPAPAWAPRRRVVKRKASDCPTPVEPELDIIPCRLNRVKRADEIQADPSRSSSLGPDETRRLLHFRLYGLGLFQWFSTVEFRPSTAEERARLVDLMAETLTIPVTQFKIQPNESKSSYDTRMQDLNLPWSRAMIVDVALSRFSPELAATYCTFRSNLIKDGIKPSPELGSVLRFIEDACSFVKTRYFEAVTTPTAPLSLTVPIAAAVAVTSAATATISSVSSDPHAELHASCATAVKELLSALRESQALCLQLQEENKQLKTTISVKDDVITRLKKSSESGANPGAANSAIAGILAVSAAAKRHSCELDELVKVTLEQLRAKPPQ